MFSATVFSRCHYSFYYIYFQITLYICTKLFFKQVIHVFLNEFHSTTSIWEESNTFLSHFFHCIWFMFSQMWHQISLPLCHHIIYEFRPPSPSFYNYLSKRTTTFIYNWGSQEGLMYFSVSNIKYISEPNFMSTTPYVKPPFLCITPGWGVTECAGLKPIASIQHYSVLKSSYNMKFSWTKILSEFPSLQVEIANENAPERVLTWKECSLGIEPTNWLFLPQITI
jgi:hypothetical protein